MLLYAFYEKCDVTGHPITSYQKKNIPVLARALTLEYSEMKVTSPGCVDGTFYFALHPLVLAGLS